MHVGEGEAEAGEDRTLRTWFLRTFGKGFAKHFSCPTMKSSGPTPDVLTAEWVAPFVPKPSIQEVIKRRF